VPVFFRPWDSLLASKSRVRLLRVLLGVSRPLSGREAARLANTSLPIAQRALHQLVAAGVVLREEAAAQHLYRSNDESVLVREGLRPLFAAEEERVRATLGELVRILDAKSNGLDTRASSVYLFGSAARGDDVPGSDFDLLVITDDADVEGVHDLLSTHAPDLLRRFGVALSPIVIGVASARRQLADPHSVVRAAMDEGRHIHGPSLEEIADGDAGAQKAGRPAASGEVPEGGLGTAR
jgi:predicted nucleotidyltransferase